MFYILRRRGLGLGSCTKIQQQSKEEIKIIRNDKQPIFTEDDTVLRWGCTSNLNNQHIFQLNKSASIKLVNNKKEFRFLLQEKYPDLVPKTWSITEDQSITYPCIVRPEKHAQGKYLFLCNSYPEVFHLCCVKHPHLSLGYISEYIPKVAEYRVCFIQGLVAWIAEKTPKNPNDIAWNVNQGGKFHNVPWKKWPINVINTAYIAYKESGLYLSGIDVMVDNDGRSYVLEANSAPSHTSPYRIQCTTKCIDYGIQNGFEPLEPSPYFTKYGKWLHPALKNI